MSFPAPYSRSEFEARNDIPADGSDSKQEKQKMAGGMIPRSFIDELINRADIVDVINARVPLQKKGRDYMACCPFHNEKSPSFSVSIQKQFYHCFGCGVHGNAIDFLMEYNHLDFVEAIETLAESMGLDVPREAGKRMSPQKQQQKKGLRDLMTEAANYFQNQLAANGGVQQYIQQRGLSDEVVKRFALGFSSDAWDGVIKQFKGRYSEQQLVDSGLAIRNEEKGRVYDRYRNRLMFPIRNGKGQVIGFGGRVLGDELPKYINSPETELFHKGNELYGLHEARQQRKLERMVVVEGYMDVIALVQYGISNTVATLGTATTSRHLEILFRTVTEVVFCFDGDRAGKEAAWRALNNALPILRDDKEIRFLFLPEGADPDSMVRDIGHDAFETQLDEATPLSQYFIDRLSEDHNLSSREGRARFLDQASGLLKQMPETLLKTQLINELARMTNVDSRDIVRKQVSKPQKNANNRFSGLQNSRKTIDKTPVIYACILLLAKPSLIELVKHPEQIALSGLKDTDLLATIVESIEECPHITPAALIERWRDTLLGDRIASLIRMDAATDDDAVIQADFLSCLSKIQGEADNQRYETLLHKISSGGLDVTDLSRQEIGDYRFLDELRRKADWLAEK